MLRRKWERCGGEGQDESIQTGIQKEVKTRETKSSLGRVATGCNLDHIGVARVYSKYAWTMASPYGV